MRRLVVTLTLGLALVAPAGAGAAQSVGLTWDPTSVKVFRYSVNGGHDPEGMLVKATGQDGKTFGVRVRFPPNWQTVDKLPVRFNTGGGMTAYPCEENDPFNDPIPDLGELQTKNCRLIPVGGGDVLCVVQVFAKRVKDFGGLVSDGPYDIYVSAYQYKKHSTIDVYPNRAVVVFAEAGRPYSVPGLPGESTDYHVAKLQGYPRWSKYHTRSFKNHAIHHFPVLFGSLTYGGYGVYGPGDNLGAPTDEFGRNVYIDTLDSDYGPGWRRIMGVLTQPEGGTYCYEFSKKGASGGKTGISASNTYRLTAVGPGLTPVVRTEFHGPTFPFGNGSYNPLKDTWGTNLSDEQVAALKLQATVMGPDWARPVKGTDCAKTLRQLPAGFLAP